MSCLSLADKDRDLADTRKELEREVMENISLSIGLKAALDYYDELYNDWLLQKKEIERLKNLIPHAKNDMLRTDL